MWIKHNIYTSVQGGGRLVRLSPDASDVFRYGRVYATAADPYHHSVGPTTTYGVGTMVSSVKTHTQPLWKAPVSGYVCGEHPAPVTPAILHLSTGQSVQRRVQPLHSILRRPEKSKEVSLEVCLGLADLWRCRTGYEILQLLGNVEMVFTSCLYHNLSPERLNRLKL